MAIMKSARYHIFFLLFIAQVSFAQQDGFNGLPIDSALVWLNENHVDNPENFHQRALKILERTYQLNDDQLKGEAHQLLMRWHAFHVLFTIDSIFYHGEKAIDHYKLTNDQKNLAATYSELAFEYIEGNDLKRSEKLIFDAIAIYESLDDQKGLGTAYHRMASILLYQKKPDLAIKYGLQSVKNTEESKDYENSTLAWLVLVLAYVDAGEMEKAIHAASKCIETITIYNIDDDFTLARAYGYRGDAWSELKNYQQALDDNLKSYAIIEAKIGAERSAAKTYRYGIGYNYYLQGKYEEALPHLEASITGYIELGQAGKPKMQDYYEQIADCYYQLGDYQKAYQSQQSAFVIFDTLMQNRVANLESESLIKYETGKKDQALAEQATIIQQKDRIQLLGTGFIGLLLLFLGTLFYYLRRNKKIAKALLAKNQENELLLKEIHHRVKNNLQTISSLLTLQSANIIDEAALEAVKESQNRVRSMALIHQKLYQGENLAAVEMRSYFETMGKAMLKSFGKRATGVSLAVEMPELELDVDTAIPIGLIVNELMTNSLKYAFPDDRNGKIEISLIPEPDKHLCLRIADNGVGLTAPTDATMGPGTGFGGQLVKLLTMQLGGELEQQNSAGTATLIRFRQSRKAA